MPPSQVSADVATQWQAPLPHQGTLVSLSQWWQQQGDPTLLALIEAAEAASLSVAQSLSRIEAAKSIQAGAGAALLPNINASVGASRGVSLPNVPVASSLQSGVQIAWELDLVGANREANIAAVAQLEGMQAQWHDARVLVAAEVANLYFGLRTCQQLLEVTLLDSASRLESARLADISAKAGFVAVSFAHLAQAGAAEGRNRVVQQASQCELDTKALVAMTALTEPVLKMKMAVTSAAHAQHATFNIALVPAQTIAQRPDVFAAERDVAVASAQVGSARAQRYPRLTLNGSIGQLSYGSEGTTTNLSTWSFGPLALTLPLFDGGQREANVAAAQARYAEAVAGYRAKVRLAVREVEEALVNLHSTEARSADSELATQAYAQALTATQARHDQGLASAMELEETRRVALASQFAQATLNLERQRAWVALYRALGGGYEHAAVVFKN